MSELFQLLLEQLAGLLGSLAGNNLQYITAARERSMQSVDIKTVAREGRGWAESPGTSLSLRTGYPNGLPPGVGASPRPWYRGRCWL